MNETQAQIIARRKTIYVVVVVALVLGHFVIRNWMWKSSQQFHTVSEAIAMSLALFVGILALVRFYSKKTSLYLFIGTGYLGTALLDGYHAVVTSAQFESYFQTVNAYLIPWSWLASRVFLAVFMCGAVLSLGRNSTAGTSEKVAERTVYLSAGLFTLGCVLFFAFIKLGAAYFRLSLLSDTARFRPQELVAGLFFLLAALGFLRLGRWQNDVFHHWLIISLIVATISQVAFMAFSGKFMGLAANDQTPFDMMFDAAHLLKVVSYACVLTGLLLNMFGLFRQAEESVQEINRSKNLLQKANKDMCAEESRTQAIIDSTADVIVSLDEAGVILSANSAVQEMFGYEGAELPGQNAVLLSPAPFDNQANYQHRQLAPGEHFSFGADSEVTGRRKDGTKFSISLRVTELNHLGEKLFIATDADITLRKEAEKERLGMYQAIRSAVQRLVTATHQILATTSQQATGSQEQVATVAQTVSTADNIAQTAKESVERANQVVQAAKQIDQVGNAGQQSIEHSMRAILQVKEHVEMLADNIMTLAERAQAIGDITATVKDIAEQTNVLALNAAVEASRAGEHGKGFAVVAAEVKSLAEQSKKATGQVHNILIEIQRATNNAVMSTEHGTKSVSAAGDVIAETGETISRLANTISDSAATAQQIALSANQQAVGIVQLNQGIRNIDKATKQNLAAIRQVEQAAQNLNELSNELSTLTSSYEV